MKRSHLRAWIARHRLFLLITLLFVSFRLLAIVLFRPGGFVADFSDYDFYMEWGRLTPRGYAAYDNLWTAYPPLFPALMLPIFELSARIPPWVDPRFFFHTFLGAALLVFETGNLVLIYRLAGKIEVNKIERRGDWEIENVSASLRSSPHRLIAPILYALLFAPVYTLLGWFESMPLFFMLLGLDLLLSKRRPGWVGSAVAAALGFLTKLTPAVLVPIAVRWLGSRLSVNAARREWFSPTSAGNLLRPTIYALLFFAVVIGVGYPFVRANPQLAFSSFQVQSIRPPWQSLWAVLDGYFGYGLVPLDMRNLAGLDGPLWQSSLPWTWITVGFVALYLWLYTRPYDWQQPRTPVAFAAVSVIWLFLYSKGWSPQFVVWVLAFTVLLLPTFRGVLIAIVLMLSNFIEANIFLIMLPDEQWIMVITVLVRTVLLLALAVEFLGQIWPDGGVVKGAAVRRIAGGMAWATMAASVLGLVIGAPVAAQAYAESRLAQHPCRQTIDLLQEQAPWPDTLIVTEQTEAWEQIYPWLRTDYTIRVLDGYSPDEDPAAVKARRMADLIQGEPELWWLTLDEGPTWPELPQIQHVETFALDACRATRLAVRPAAATAQANVASGVAGGLVRLLNQAWTMTDDTLHLVLYWEAASPVTESYTVFTQLFDPAGSMVAQQDNLPVTGLAPTDTWTPQQVIRDPYVLPLPATLMPGRYRLLVGLYTGQQRQIFTRADGRSEDFVEFWIEVDSE